MIHLEVDHSWSGLVHAYMQLEDQLLSKLEKPAEARDLLALAQDLSGVGVRLQRVARDALSLARKRLAYTA